MTITMLLSALLFGAVAAFIAATAAAGRWRTRAAKLEVENEALRFKLQRPALPPLVMRNCTEAGFEGWAEVDLGEHGDAVRVVLRFDDGDKAKYGGAVLQLLAASAASATWEQA